jgi:hypothetical protein
MIGRRSDRRELFGASLRAIVWHVRSECGADHPRGHNHHRSQEKSRFLTSRAEITHDS